MKTLFERVFNGSDEMFAKAEEEVNKIVAEVGRDAPLTLPSTAYFCACIYAYIGKKVTTTGELQDALSTDGAQLLNDHMSGDFPEIPTGKSTISWAAFDGNDNAGSVTQIRISPRWRCR